MSAAVKVKGTARTTRLRKVECTACGCIARMSRAAMARSGVPFCGCGAGRMLVDQLDDALRVLPYEELEAHPDFARMAKAEQERDIRAAVKVSDGRMRCGGCNAFIPATNHPCGCGFSNDIRSGRNLGQWVSGASYRPGGRPDGEMPF